MTDVKTFELGQFQVEMPRFLHAQADAIAWSAEAHARATALGDGAIPASRMRERFLRFGCKPEQIGFRGFDTVDINNHDFGATGLYAIGVNRETGVTTAASSSQMGERSAFFLERSTEVFEALYPTTGADAVRAKVLNSDAPDHLIHVTCTGYVSPSAPQRLVNARNWREKTEVTHAYHMGCYASLPAVRMAEGLGRSLAAKRPGSHRVDIVHTEICTLHMNPAATGAEEMVIHSLFSDGHIKYSLRPEGSMKQGFRVLDVTEELVKDSTDDMTWTPVNWGFRMGLSRDVPKKIGMSLRPFLERLARNAGCDFAALLKDARFAIHPGGPRIIGAVQEILELSDEQTAQSKRVLFERGNMSSATLPHVWKALDDEHLPSGTKIVSLAFGPGLTIFGAVFDVI